MSADSIDLADLAKLVSIQLGKRNVQAKDRFIEDLGAESADLVNLAAAIEDRFGIVVDEEAMADVKTVADLARVVREQC